ncbi:MAG: thioesterase family protein [Hyphomicrobiaceae bacterium]
MTKDPFRYYLRVRYQECDAQLVVFNARYGDYVDIATMEFFRAIGLAEEVASSAFDVQLVKQTTTWKAPARNNQVLQIAVSAQNLGTTSFTIAAQFRIAGTLAVICEIETVYVRVDNKTLTKRPLGDDHRALLTRGAPGVMIDHAGYQATSS